MGHINKASMINIKNDHMMCSIRRCQQQLIKIWNQLSLAYETAGQINKSKHAKTNHSKTEQVFPAAVAAASVPAADAHRDHDYTSNLFLQDSDSAKPEYSLHNHDDSPPNARRHWHLLGWWSCWGMEWRCRYCDRKMMAHERNVEGRNRTKWEIRRRMIGEWIAR